MVHHKFGHQHQPFDYIYPPATCGELHTLMNVMKRRIKLYQAKGETAPLGVINQYKLLSRAFESNCAEV